MCGEGFAAGIGEVDVDGELESGEAGLGEGVKIVHGDAFGAHDFFGGGVVGGYVRWAARGAYFLGFSALGNWGGGGEDELGVGAFEACDDQPQIAAVTFDWNLMEAVIQELEVMEAEVEMNHVPFVLAKPTVHHEDAVAGGAAIEGNAVDVRLAGEELAHGQAIADGDGIADEQDAGQLGVVFDRRDGHAEVLREEGEDG